jgi:hypothetical protein
MEFRIEDTLSAPLAAITVNEWDSLHHPVYNIGFFLPDDKYLPFKNVIY